MENQFTDKEICIGLVNTINEKLTELNKTDRLTIVINGRLSSIHRVKPEGTTPLSVDGTHRRQFEYLQGFLHALTF